MKDQKYLTPLLLLSILILLAAACTPRADGADPPTPTPVLLPATATATATAQPGTNPTPTLAPVTTAATATLVPATATAVPATATTAATQPPATATQVPPTPWPETQLPVLGQTYPMPTEGCVVYQNGQVRDEDLPVVHTQPNSAAPIIGQLGRDRWLPGVQAQGDWYEVRLSAQLSGWVPQHGTGIHGACGSTAPTYPILGSLEAPPVTGCVIYQSGRVLDEDLPLVYAGPSTDTTILGQFGRNRWANGLQQQNGWFEIVVGPGATGWLPAATVGNNGQCAFTPPPEVPVIMNRGAPANDRCVVFNPKANVDLVNVRAQRDETSTLVAQLGNWAEVLQVQGQWYEILIPQGGSGWVPADKVTPSFGCGPISPTPARIQFPAGSNSTTVTGQLAGEQQARYLMWAGAGQTMTISVSSPGDAVLFHLEGVADGQVYKHLLDGNSSWQGTLTVAQDYLLTLDQSGDSASFTLTITID